MTAFDLFLYLLAAAGGLLFVGFVVVLIAVLWFAIRGWALRGNANERPG